MRSAWQDGVQVAWDATSFTIGTDCLFKYQLVMIEGWRPRRKSAHLEFGGLYATALEHFHKHIAAGLSREDALYEVVREALIETWEHDRDEEGNRLPGTGRPWESDHNLKTRANLIRTIVWYVEHFADDPLQVVTLSDGRPAVEFSFSFSLTDDILWSGHIDRLVTYEGDIYVQDQKTTGTTITQKFFSDFNPDNQMSGYTFAGQVIYSAPIKGVVIDAAQIAVGFSRFERGFTFRSKAQLEEWQRDTVAEIQVIQDATRRGYFPRRPSSCNKWGGCVFRHACSRSPEVRTQFLLADFERGEPWNPLKERT